ncbi:unnamed protein product [Brassica oleracea]
MAEEHRCQTPEGHHLCSNNCGFLSATMNIFSKCYGNLCLKQQTCMKSTVKSFLSSSVEMGRVDRVQLPMTCCRPIDNRSSMDAPFIVRLVRWNHGLCGSKELRKLLMAMEHFNQL